MDKPTIPTIFDRSWAMASGNCIVRSGGRTLRYVSSTAKNYSFRANGFFSYPSDPNTAILPYVEYTISKMSPKSVVCVGFCTGEYKNQGQLPGNAQNTFAFFNEGFYSRNSNNTKHEAIKFKEGDVVGVGVAFDSWNGWFPFTTLNGKLTGHWNNFHHVPKGMDLYPVVGFTGTALEIEINFGASPLKAAGAIQSLKKVPSTENYIDQLPKEIVELVVAEAAKSDKDVAALTLPRVCRSWDQYSSTNDIWKHHYLEVWHNQNPELKVKNWKKFFARRWILNVNNASIGKMRNVEEIENCDWEFACPLAWTELTFVSEKERFCDKCNRTVIAVDTDDELQQKVKLGHCVAIYAPSRADFMLGEIAVPDEYDDNSDSSC